MKIIKIAKTNRSAKIKLRLIDVLVDDADYDWLKQYDWSIRNGYAATKIGRTYQSMHRLIMGVLPKEPILIDHIDGNPFNNQRANLRRANRFQNQQNRKTNRNNTLPKGIRKLPSGKYNVRVQAFGERWVIGTFDTLEEAISERNRVAKHKHGDFFRESHPVKPSKYINDSN